MKKSSTERLSAFQSGVAGAISAVMAGAITTPLDVVKTRVMLAEVSCICMNHVPILTWGVRNQTGENGLMIDTIVRKITPCSMARVQTTITLKDKRTAFFQ